MPRRLTLVHQPHARRVVLDLVAVGARLDLVLRVKVGPEAAHLPVAIAIAFAADAGGSDALRPRVVVRLHVRHRVKEC